MAITNADFDIVAAQVISLLNAQDVTTAYPTDLADIGDDRRNPDEIREAIVESDIEARIAICETPGNGFRNGFVAVSATLTPLSGNAQSAKLPERIGPVSRVEVKVAASDTLWIAGEQCPLNEIQEMISNSDAFQNTAHNTANSPLGGYYYIDEMSDIITWTGNAVRVYTATLGVVDRADPITLLTPDAYSPFLVARSLARLYKHGDSPAFMEWYDRQARELMAMIRLGADVLRQVEPVIREAA